VVLAGPHREVASRLDRPQATRDTRDDLHDGGEFPYQSRRMSRPISRTFEASKALPALTKRLAETRVEGRSRVPTTPITAEDLGATLTAFALSFTAAMMSPHNQTPDEVLLDLANELHGLVAKMQQHGDNSSPAAKSLSICASMLMATEGR